MSETNLLQSIRLACSRDDVRLFRNNVAMAWVGTVHSQGGGSITLRNYRPLHAGLCEGSSDLIGWTKREGSAIFTAVECKSKRGRLSEAQWTFLSAVSVAGGIAIEARSVDDAERALKSPGQ